MTDLGTMACERVLHPIRASSFAEPDPHPMPAGRFEWKLPFYGTWQVHQLPRGRPPCDWFGVNYYTRQAGHPSPLPSPRAERRRPAACFMHAPQALLQTRLAVRSPLSSLRHVDRDGCNCWATASAPPSMALLGHRIATPDCSNTCIDRDRAATFPLPCVPGVDAGRL